jgi:hypothetical protein
VTTQAKPVPAAAVRLDAVADVRCRQRQAHPAEWLRTQLMLCPLGSALQSVSPMRLISSIILCRLLIARADDVIA